MQTEEQPQEEVLSIRASEVSIRPVAWLWPWWIPQGKITVFDGHPGFAKSTILLDIGARVTTGRSMPDGSPGPQGAVIVINYEDDAEDTIVPRFVAAGGDPEQLILSDTVRTAEGLEPLELPTHIGLLEELVTDTGAVLVVIDPLMAALAADVKSGIDHNVRRALSPVRSMAERTGAAVVIVRHLNKNTNVGDPIMRGGGSIGIIGAARAGLIVGQDPDDSTRRVLAISKTNLAPSGTPSLLYKVTSDPKLNVAAIEWLGHTDRTAREIIDPDQDGSSSGAVGEAVGILTEYLEDGPKLATDAQRYCAEAGIAKRTLDRAKKRLGVKARPRDNGEGRHWHWELPEGEERQ